MTGGLVGEGPQKGTRGATSHDPDSARLENDEMLGPDRDGKTSWRMRPRRLGCCGADGRLLKAHGSVAFARRFDVQCSDARAAFPRAYRVSLFDERSR